MIKQTILAVLMTAFIPMLLLSNAVGADHAAPSAGAKGMPGALGTIEYKPADWKGKESTYWDDTDGVAPGVAGCHVGVTQAGKPDGRFFGEACQSNQVLIESNPGAGVIHVHTGDLGHPDTFDCKAWCVGTSHPKGGICKAVAGPPPCTASAICQCN